MSRPGTAPTATSRYAAGVGTPIPISIELSMVITRATTRFPRLKPSMAKGSFIAKPLVTIAETTTPSNPQIMAISHAERTPSTTLFKVSVKSSRASFLSALVIRPTPIKVMMVQNPTKGRVYPFTSNRTRTAKGRTKAGESSSSSFARTGSTLLWISTLCAVRAIYRKTHR